MAEAYLPYQGCGPQAKSIAKAEVTLDFSTVTYDGSDHAPAVQSVSLKGKELQADQDYVYTAVRYKDAGNYNVSVMGINEYGGVKEVPWSIERAKGSIRVEPAQVTIQGAAGTTQTVNIIYEGDGDITVSESQYVTSKVINYSDVFSENSWQQIAEACANGEVPESWKIGDTKPIILTGEDAGEYKVQIIGKNQDDLDPTDEKYSDVAYNNGSKKAAITFQFVELLKTHRKMHTSNDNSCSWEKSDMRVTIMPLVLSEMPSDVKGVMRAVTKKAPQSSSDKKLISTSDKLFLLGPHEVSNSPKYADFEAEGELYQYYASGNSTIKKILGGNAANWWLRCPSTVNENAFCAVNIKGTSIGIGYASLDCVAPAFCI